MTQNERLEYLVERFKADSIRYRELDVGQSVDEKRTALRSLMNIRQPRPLDADTLLVQDEYLRERAREKGIVPLAEIPTIREQYGSRLPHADRISLWQGDIVRLEADAIVNAANAQMLGCFQPMHSCIDNCIHSFAGVELRLECDRQMETLRARFGPDYEQPTAVPMLTEAYNLPAKKVVHVVGPIVQYRLTKGLEEDLAACYRNVLDLCAENALRSVAFCCISTGVFRFPADRAAQIAVETVSAWLDEQETAMERVIFVVHGDRNRALYEALLRE